MNRELLKRNRITAGGVELRPYPRQPGGMRFFVAMRLIVNGESIDSAAATLGALLGELKLMRERVAVEINLRIISKKDYDTCLISDGDRIEIVNFVGGG